MAAYKLTFGASLVAALANAVFGTLLAWVLTRYEFPGRRFIDAMVDFPVRTANRGGGLDAGQLVRRERLAGAIPRAAGNQRRVHAARRDDCTDVCGNAVRGADVATGAGKFRARGGGSRGDAGAGRHAYISYNHCADVVAADHHRFALAFARAIGEYGSVVFISGNLPFKTEIAPQLIVMRLEEYDYAGAIALAVVLLIFSFALLAVINVLEQWARVK
jgi:sulfate/thiosulfate transport system permease protein